MGIRNLAFIGSGKSVIDCVKVALESNCNIFVVIDGKNKAIGSQTEKFFKKENIQCLTTENINSAEIIETLKEFSPDYIFSANNFQIIRDELLKVPSYGFLNFHNAPLPKYGGLNACSWAIVNGEKEHGITWHFVDLGVDTGDIVAQKKFPIKENETAIQLIMRCIDEGVNVFRELLPKILSDNLDRSPQDFKQKVFYKSKELPNGGLVNFSWNYKKLDCFLRGLNFNPFPTLMSYPKVVFGDQFFYLDSIRLVETLTQTTAGLVVESGDKLLVQVQDGLIELLKVRDVNGKIISVSNLVDQYQIEKDTKLGA